MACSTGTVCLCPSLSTAQTEKLRLKENKGLPLSLALGEWGWVVHGGEEPGVFIHVTIELTKFLYQGERDDSLFLGPQVTFCLVTHKQEVGRYGRGPVTL